MVILITVGLPARGKSYISQKLLRSLTWLGYNVKVFNAGTLRRKLISLENLNETYFNENAKDTRDKIAYECFSQLLQWMENSDEDHKISIFDATNTTLARRKKLVDMVNDRWKVIFIESIVDSPQIIDENIKMKQFSPDYQNTDQNTALEDFKVRISYYENIYKSLTIDEGISFIKTINVGEKMELYNVKGTLENDVIFFINNIIITRPIIYLSRHGESQYNTVGKLGGDSSITENGQQYAKLLSQYINDEHENNLSQLKIYTSTLNRTKQTASFIQDNDLLVHNRKELDEIHAGKFDGYTYKQISDEFPDEAVARSADKLNYRYPMGESYKDLINRTKSIIMEAETNTQPTIIISHQATLRVIYAYFMGISSKDIPHIQIPLHTVIKLIPYSHSYKKEVIKLL